MNSRQRRKLRRLEQRAWGDHVDYYVFFEPTGIQLSKIVAEDEEWGYCQDCGAYIDEDTYYVTASGDVFCRDCGRAADEAADDDAGYYDFYTTYEDIVQGETGGRFIGEGSENSADDE